MNDRLTGWMVAGVLLAMLIGTIHALVDLLLERRAAERHLYPWGWDWRP